MRIKFTSNQGAGYAQTLNVTDGMTVSEFLKEQVPGFNPDNHVIRVNRNVASADQRLYEGDAITLTPNKVQGAA